MLKKSLVLGVLAAMTLAPAAFAGQTQGNSTVTTIEAGVVGNGNRTNIKNGTNVHQSQSKYETRRVRRHRSKCPGGSQTQGNVTDTAINTGVVGNRNNTRINNVTNVSQAQSAACY
ncbi:hypothetical protein DSM106972_008760 [Dulcicalothrix desertica PCC 7102]|uniref:Filamentous haemagglutinin FhaB/tRNA nuclease CdiA-like TPS domain-containing protein n=1 Tax=Dulcicalothrix desertica PCC 7102 TaxID=232991 RepID=A0A433VRS5_9CYAN|nr:hypothetical protein [Dulcicalothrix desertica]RUT08821.1 hypothetical protein DSM106972_008740 [Dulcicalothrix desertica PCC 7102]RUT08823.1 hypothetical protein DSM106972_008760 [Dulcicalothrix desertica PCC 7102]TWH44160.1 hypothetical protein CAL7102_07943 [Dulcicalothrix desertica PCC 7102]TWH44161.1 hypothetical protein CAL7102_07944 [Dulcicalothrix desertica PCC 7102]